MYKTQAESPPCRDFADIGSWSQKEEPWKTDFPSENKICLILSQGGSTCSSESVHNLSKDDKESFYHSARLGSEKGCKNHKNIDIGRIKYKEESQFCGNACTEDSVGSQAYLQSVSHAKNDSPIENTRVKQTTWESSVDYQPTSDAEQQTSMDFNEDDLFSRRDFDLTDKSSFASSPVETDDDLEKSNTSKCGYMRERHPKYCKDQSTQTNHTETKTAPSMHHVKRCIYVYHCFQFIRTQSNCLSICNSKKPIAVVDITRSQCYSSGFEIPSVLSGILKHIAAIEVSISDSGTSVLVLLHDPTGLSVVLVKTVLSTTIKRAIEYNRAHCDDIKILPKGRQAIESSDLLQATLKSLPVLKSDVQLDQERTFDCTKKICYSLDFRHDEDFMLYHMSSVMSQMDIFNETQGLESMFERVHKFTPDINMGMNGSRKLQDQTERNISNPYFLHKDKDNRAIVSIDGSETRSVGGMGREYVVERSMQSVAHPKDMALNVGENGLIANKTVKMVTSKQITRRMNAFGARQLKSRKFSCDEAHFKLEKERRKNVHSHSKKLLKVAKRSERDYVENSRVQGASNEGVLEVRIDAIGRDMSVQQTSQHGQASMLSAEYRCTRPEADSMHLLVKVKTKSGEKKVVCKVFSATEELRIRRDVERFFLKKHEMVCTQSHLPKSLMRLEFKWKLKDMSTEHLLEKILKEKIKGNALEFLRRSLHVSQSFKIITVMPVQHQRSGLDGYFQRLMEGEELTYRQQMRYEWLRIKSYWSFPLNTGMSIFLLARNGFYFTGRTSECKSVD